MLSPSLSSSERHDEEGDDAEHDGGDAGDQRGKRSRLAVPRPFGLRLAIGRLVSRSARTTGAPPRSSRHRLVRTTGPEWSVGGGHGYRRLADVARRHRRESGSGSRSLPIGREVRWRLCRHVVVA